MTALGAKVERVIINDLEERDLLCARIIRAENELQQKNHRVGCAAKRLHCDGHPAESAYLREPEVWDEVDDMSDVLRKMEEEGPARSGNGIKRRE
jgi:hypothetical protein